MLNKEQILKNYIYLKKEIKQLENIKLESLYSITLTLMEENYFYHLNKYMNNNNIINFEDIKKNNNKIYLYYNNIDQEILKILRNLMVYLYLLKNKNNVKLTEILTISSFNIFINKKETIENFYYLKNYDFRITRINLNNNKNYQYNNINNFHELKQILYILEKENTEKSVINNLQKSFISKDIKYIKDYINNIFNILLNKYIQNYAIKDSIMSEIKNIDKEKIEKLLLTTYMKKNFNIFLKNLLEEYNNIFFIFYNLVIYFSFLEVVLSEYQRKYHSIKNFEKDKIFYYFKTDKVYFINKKIMENFRFLLNSYEVILK